MEKAKEKLLKLWGSLRSDLQMILEHLLPQICEV